MDESGAATQCGGPGNQFFAKTKHHLTNKGGVFYESSD